MTAQLCPKKFTQAVDDVCESLGIVGDDIRSHLKREIPSKVLFRRASDVVLLSGHTGTGKEVIASACHHAARKALSRQGELVEVNCANLGNGIFESQLFGYKKGAFTGADRDFAGLVGRASGGTLVLDEIQSLEPQDQARLLRFLGEREYRSVGDDSTRSSDALIILSTNRDLREMVDQGEFRRDLMDRAPAKIQIPALYERRRDIGQLAQQFSIEVAESMGFEEFYGLTRRARADVETAVIRFGEVSIRRLREIIRDAVFTAAVEDMPDALDSDWMLPILEREFAFKERDRDLQDTDELEREFDFLVARSQLREISGHHEISARSLQKLVDAVHGIIGEIDKGKRTYRNITERTHRLSKVALWLCSGAETQAEFRRYFGSHNAQMPTKSVAHQIYHEVFPEARKG
jgi:transcriptional regulator with PAS, ATPase and Fis domain